MSMQLLLWLQGVAADLALIDNAPVGVEVLDAAMGVHVVSLRGGVQSEALAAPQKDVQVVMEVVVQPAAGPCIVTATATVAADAESDRHLHSCCSRKQRRAQCNRYTNRNSCPAYSLHC